MEYKVSLKAARINANLGLTEAAASLGVSSKTLSHWENGKSSPRADQLYNICALYGVPMDYLRFD